MAALLRWCIRRGVEAFPSFLMRLRNADAYFITRAGDLEVQSWADTTWYVQIPMPWWWADFILGAPKIEWFLGKIGAPHFAFTKTDKGCLSFHVDEWNASYGIGLQFRGDNGIWPVTIGCRPYSISERLDGRGILPWSGERRTRITECAIAKQEMRSFPNSLRMCRPEHCILITPSEVTDDIADVSMNWSQIWRIGGNISDGFFCVARGTYISDRLPL